MKLCVTSQVFITLILLCSPQSSGSSQYMLQKNIGFDNGLFSRGDHTSSTLYLTIVPPKTECVVFSIDGSFTASVSVTGRDPKVRAGAVDVVR